MRPPAGPFAGLLLLALVVGPVPASGHPMGNFSISHHARIRVMPDVAELRYVIDMAEIPTFQEIQDGGFVAEVGHPSVGPYLARTVDALGAGLSLELNGRRLPLQSGAGEVLFTPGAGDLPTMKVGVAFRADLRGAAPGVNRLVYRDRNFPDRVGWKEVVAAAGPGMTLVESSVSEHDRSRGLTDYPTDLLDSPPQVTEASLLFALEATATVRAVGGPTGAGVTPARSARSTPATNGAPAQEAVALAEPAPPPVEPVALRPNRRASRGNAFTDLVTDPGTGAGFLAVAALVAAGLGAFHALEPGHGKTVVAAYLAGTRGTARHALLLGLIVTASHTAGVYLLGLVTLYASRHVVPDRLYPWLAAVSGLIIAGLGIVLFLRRLAGAGGHPHTHDHEHPHAHDHAHEHPHSHAHGHGGHRHHHLPAGRISARELLALGVTGGIVPCPAALVVLLSALALRRVGLGLFLIVAFSAGLAAVLIAIGLLVVYARRLMARWPGDGRLLTRWLPLTSSAVIVLIGLAIAAQAVL